MCALWERYLLEQGGEQEAEKAFAWLFRAAAASYPPAVHHWGRLLADAGAVEPGDQALVQCFGAAAAAGYAPAMRDLGLMYAEGRGVEKDRELAIGWLTKAAQAGDVPSREALEKLGQQ